MFHFKGGKFLERVLGMAVGASFACGMAHAAVSLPDPTLDEKPVPHQEAEKLVVSGGCFWGVQAVFQHMKGVTTAVSGYAGGDATTAHYDMVSTGRTGHAESVEITYDPNQVTTGQILKVFFAVAHNPTELDYQGPDHGTQYRSAIFTTTDEQKKVADAYIAQLDQSKAFTGPIVTKVQPLKGFYAAEDYHQNYATLHPDNMYIKINDAPKVAALQSQFPQLCTK